MVFSVSKNSNNSVPLNWVFLIFPSVLFWNPADAMNYAVGDSVLVPRSDGSDSPGHVVEIEADKGIVTVEIGEPGSSLRKRVLMTSLKDGPASNAPVPTADGAGAKYPIGTSVYVLRSNGQETPATVKEYEPTKKIYTLDLGDGQLKRANEISMRMKEDEAPPPPPAAAEPELHLTDDEGGAPPPPPEAEPDI